MTGRRGVFLDRDGTIIEDTGYIADPAVVRLLPDVAGAIARLNGAGIAAIVVTNQSGIARGLIDETAYASVAARLDALLAAEGVRLDAQYHCPHHPDFTGPCECRKPGPLLYQRAAAEHGLSLDRCWWVGDRVRDVLPAETFGASGILVHHASDTDDENATRFARAPDLSAAVDLILKQHSSS